jgi:excisionase family DNA binding protein
MTAPARSLPAKTRRVATGVPPEDRAAAAHLALALAPARGRAGRVQLIGPDGASLDLPEPLAMVVARAASLISEGHQVSVIAEDELLSTQAAAKLLNVSRQYVVRLADQGDLPSFKVGSHRRLRTSDVAAYKRDRDAKRDTALDRLAALSEEMGGYALDS